MGKAKKITLSSKATGTLIAEHLDAINSEEAKTSTGTTKKCTISKRAVEVVTEALVEFVQLIAMEAQKCSEKTGRNKMKIEDTTKALANLDLQNFASADAACEESCELPEPPEQKHKAEPDEEP